MEPVTYSGSTRWHDLQVNRIPLLQPFVWLSKGWHDIWAAGMYSLRYGAVLALVSAVLTLIIWTTGGNFLIPFLIAIFLIIAPPLGIGLYQISAHLERGHLLASCSAYEAWKKNQFQIAMVSSGLIMFANTWLAANVGLFMLLYEGLSPPLDDFFNQVFLSEKGTQFAIASLVTGFVAAWCSYAISAITVPMLIDRKVDGFTALRFSIRSVLHNISAMTLWAGLIVFIVGLGIITFYLGFIIAIPLIGHASWHAYRDLVPADIGKNKPDV